MKRYIALWKKTWFAWAAIAATCTVVATLNPVFLIIFLVNIPVWIAMFVYFAHMRFDEHGHHRDEAGEH